MKRFSDDRTRFDTLIIGVVHGDHSLLNVSSSICSNLPRADLRLTTLGPLSHGQDVSSLDTDITVERRRHQSEQILVLTRTWTIVVTVMIMKKKSGVSNLFLVL